LDNTAPDVPLDTRLSRRQLPVGAQIGAFWFTPSAQLDESFDDNIFATPTGALADAITNLTGRASLNYSKGSSSFDMQSRLVGHLYAAHPTENAWEGSVQTSFTSTVHNDLQLGAKGEIQRLVDPRTDPTGLQGNTPTTYELYTASGMALIGHAEDNLLSLRMGVNRISYDPLQGSQGPIETTDRDNNELYGDVDFRHTFSPRRAVYAKIRPNTRNYDLKFDQSGFQRGSNGVRIDAGVDWDIDSVFLVNLETGIQHQSYDDSRFGNINQPDGRISLSWWPTRLTNVRLNFTHEYYEAFFNTSPGAVRNKIVARVDHELRRRWVAGAAVSLERDDLKGQSTRYTTEVAELNLKYLFAEGFSGGVGYMYARQTTTGTTAGTGSTTFQRNIVTFTVKKLF